MIRRAERVTRLGFTTLLLLLFAALPVFGQDDDAVDLGLPEIRLQVTELSTVIGPGSLPPTAEGQAVEAAGRDDVFARVIVENLGDVPVGSLTVTLEVFNRVTSRSALHVALLDGEPRRVSRFIGDVDSDVRDGDDLQPGDGAGVELRRTAAQLGWTTAQDRRGVYPVQVTVSQGRQVLDQVVVAVTFLSQTFPGPFDPLHAAVLVPLTDAPWRGADGTYPPDVDGAIQPGGRLDVLLRALERAGAGTRFSPAPAPHLMEDLADRADGFTVRHANGNLFPVTAEAPEAIRAGQMLARLEAYLRATDVPPIAGTYADADLGALAASPPPLSLDASTVIAEARRRLADQLGRQPNLGVFWSPGALDRASLDLLHATGADIAIVPWLRTDALPLDQLPATPEPVRSLRANGGRSITALVTDPWLDEDLSRPVDPHGPAVSTNRILAETAMVWMETPAVGERAIVIALPPEWSPGGPIVSRLLDGLRTAPWLALDGPGGIARRIDEPETVTLQLDRSPGLTPSLSSAIIQGREELSVLGRALVGSDDRIADRPIAEYDEDLLRATSWWWRAPSDTRASDLAASVLRASDVAFGEVHVPTGTAITLTAEDGVIPVTLQRTSGEPIEVTVEVDAGARLEWPEGSSRTVTLQPGAARTISFPTRARTTGLIAMQVTVRDPSGARTVTQATLSVRSTAISGPALAVTAATIGVLFLIGAIRRRRPPPPKLEVVRDRVV